jgi:peroxiredoxin
MKNRFITILALCLLWVSGPPASANGTNGVIADLNGLVERINGKLQQGKTNETDLASELKEFDGLLVKHKGGKSVELAQVLAMKAQLYSQVFGEEEKALDIFKQIKTDFPDVQVGGNTDAVIQALEHDIAAGKIRRSLVPGAKFPGFEEKDLSGKPLSLAGYKGKVVLVDFWATWCVPCLIELPDVLSAYRKYHDRGFEVIGISLDVDLETLRHFVEGREIPWPQYCDGKKWDSKLALEYGVEKTPTSYLLDREGKIIGVDLTDEDLAKAVAKALGEK